jgi:hypothetical protein
LELGRLFGLAVRPEFLRGGDPLPDPAAIEIPELSGADPSFITWTQAVPNSSRAMTFAGAGRLEVSCLKVNLRRAAFYVLLTFKPNSTCGLRSFRRVACDKWQVGKNLQATSHFVIARAETIKRRQHPGLTPAACRVSGQRRVLCRILLLAPVERRVRVGDVDALGVEPELDAAAKLAPDAPLLFGQRF